MKFLLVSLTALILIGCGGDKSGAIQETHVVDAGSLLSDFDQVVTFRAEQKRFLATLKYGSGLKDQVTVFEVGPEGLVERLRLEEFDLQSLSVPAPSRLPVVAVYLHHPDSLAGGPTLIAIVGQQVKVVYKGGAGQVVDLNNDGYPEVINTRWSDDYTDVPPTDTIYAWNGSDYVELLSTAQQPIFAPRLKRRITEAAEGFGLIPASQGR